MINKKTLTLICFLISTFLSSSTFAQNGESSLTDIRVDVVYLASDDLEGRETGTKGEALAAEYISQRFDELDLSPAGEDGSWLQPFTARVTNNPHAKPDEGEARTGHNVVAFLDNGATHTVVIGAHYDHLGYGEFGSRHTGDPAIHNGADDNASGIAAMLHIAEMLKSSSAKNNNYLFIAFSGEELGLFGSKYYADNPTVELSTINYMFNMDMVGRLNAEKVLAISGAGTSPVWKEKLEKIKVGGIQIKTSDSGVGPSDHTSFYLKDIPVLHFFTGQHREYHKPEDDSPKINYQGIADISDFIVQLIVSIDGKGELAFTKTKDEQQTRSSFKVTLGIMPDYVNDQPGLRVDAVLEDRPAAKAGIEDGDIILKMGDLEIKDVYAYMEALGKFEKGQEIVVVVKRGEKELKKKVRF